MELNIGELGDEESNLISSDSEDRSVNSHLQLHNNPISFTGSKKFNKDHEDSVETPGVNTPTCVVL